MRGNIPIQTMALVLGQHVRVGNEDNLWGPDRKRRTTVQQVEGVVREQRIEARARAYLHANCSHCHRPGGGSPVAMDLRYTTSLAATKTCGITPTGSDLGIAGAKLVAPGDPPSSLLVRRMRSTTSSRITCSCTASASTCSR